MSNNKLKSIASITLFTSLIGLGVWGLFKFAFPQYYPQSFGIIMVFFLVVEAFDIWFIEKSSEKENPRKLLNSYLLTKIIKMFASAALVGIYALVVKENIKSFVLSFSIFYILCLFVETFMFVKIEKRLKEKKQ